MSAAAIGTARRTGSSLEVREVVVEFGGVHALDGVSFEVAPGEIVGFIGPNGSGKTTLMNVISGVVRPSHGIVRVDGRDLSEALPEDRAARGLVRSFQDCRLFPELSVEETLLVTYDARYPVALPWAGFRMPGVGRAERDKRRAVTATMRQLGLDRFRDRTISELSTGTRRVVDLAAILAAEPRLLLLDEPTAGIAQREAEALGPLLRRLHEITGATICLVEHDVPLALSLCDRLIVMEAGRIVSQGPAEQVMEDPVAIAAYLGASPEALARSGLLRGAGTPARAGKPGSNGHARRPRRAGGAKTVMP